MLVYQNLQSIKRLTNSSLTSLIDVTNLNFKKLSDSNLEFLNNINYDEIANSFNVYSGKFELVEVTTSLTVTESGIPTFTIPSSGNAVGRSLLVDVAETQRQRFTDFPTYPTVGVPGEIVYTGVAGIDPVFGEDFIGYLHSKGWVSLTNDSSGGSAANGHKILIESTEVLTIDANYQYWVYGNFTIDGIVDNYGELVIANGALIISPSGQINNYGTGIVKIVNLALGTSVQVIIQNFIATAGIPLTITHGLNTKDFVYSTRDGNVPVDIDISYIDDNSFYLTSTGDISDGKIVIQAKI